MRISPEFESAIAVVEAAGLHAQTLERIFEWPGLRPGARTAALVIQCMVHVSGDYPRADELAGILGITTERCEAIFAGMEHPPYALTRVEPERFHRFMPSQTLEYGPSHLAEEA